MQHDLHVHFHGFSDIRPLYLDHNLFAVRKLCPVYLGERGRGKRSFLKIVDQFVKGRVELRFYGLFYLLKGEGRDIILKLSKLPYEFNRQQVRTCGEYLP